MSQVDLPPRHLPAYPASAVRAAEEPLLAAGAPLMAIAARAVELAVVRVLRKRRGAVAGARVVVLAGAGNNGGDGLFAAAGLARRGAGVQVLLTSDHPHPGGLAALDGTQTRVRTLVGDPDPGGVVAAAVAGSDVVVDAVAGIGIHGALRGLAGEVIAAAAAAGGRETVVAVDVPSGIGVDDGALPGPVLPADITVTMGAAKPGLLLPPACEVVGEVEVVDLGLNLRPRDRDVVRLGEIGSAWPLPATGDHKYTRGVLGVLAGSDAYPGAAVLATAAAVPLVGMVRYLGPHAAAQQVLARSPEVVVGAGRVQAWVLGSGIACDDAARLAQVRQVLEGALGQVPVLVDAGGLAVLPERMPATVVLTPHAGELARLLSERDRPTTRAEVEGDPVGAVRRAVGHTGATVLLKGATTLVAGADGPIYSQCDGTPWLATAGSGDVLAGVLGSLLALRSREVMAAPALAAQIAAGAALVHGRAGRRASADLGGGPIRAMQVAQVLPAVLAEAH